MKKEEEGDKKKGRGVRRGDIKKEIKKIERGLVQGQ